MDPLCEYLLIELCVACISSHHTHLVGRTAGPGCWGRCARTDESYLCVCMRRAETKREGMGRKKWTKAKRQGPGAILSEGRNPQCKCQCSRVLTYPSPLPELQQEKLRENQSTRYQEKYHPKEFLCTHGALLRGGGDHTEQEEGNLEGVDCRGLRPFNHHPLRDCPTLAPPARRVLVR